jgi:lysophospholipase L1-like esterase
VLSTTLEYLVQDYTEATQASNLMLGSSSIRKLDASLLADCGSWLNIGIGNSSIADLIRYLRLSPLEIKPARILLYAGENDIARGMSVPESYAEYLALLDLLTSRFPNSDVHILSIKPSPRRAAHWDKFDALNTRLRQHAASTPQARRKHAASSVSNGNGNGKSKSKSKSKSSNEKVFFHPFQAPAHMPLKSLFTQDGVHLTQPVIST